MADPPRPERFDRFASDASMQEACREKPLGGRKNVAPRGATFVADEDG
jgi:hypothetical protein